MGLVCDSRRWRSLTEMNSSCSSAGLFHVHSRAASAFSTWSRGGLGVRGVVCVASGVSGEAGCMLGAATRGKAPGVDARSGGRV